MSSKTHECAACHQEFYSSRGLHNHITNSKYCNDFIIKGVSSLPPEKLSILMDQGIQVRAEQENQNNDDDFPIDNIDIEIHNEQGNQTQQQMSIPYRTHEYVEVELLQLCRSLQTPLYGYDAIMKWANSAALQGYTFPSNAPSRNTVIQQLYNRFDLNGIKPKIESVILDGGGTSEVVTFDFKEMIQSLLNDKRLMQDDYLVFCNDDPLSAPLPSAYLGELCTGKWFAKAYQKLCKEEGDFLCPILLYIDGTKIDLHGRLSLKPVMFTLGIFNQETRRKPYAWRPLGFLPNSNLKSTAQGKSHYKKVRNMRECFFEGYFISNCLLLCVTG